MKRKASAVWRGGLKDGKGTISTDSRVLSDTQYSFSTRFEEGKGTNPEELIAAGPCRMFLHGIVWSTGYRGADSREHQHHSQRHSGKDRCWIYYHSCTSGCDG